MPDQIASLGIAIDSSSATKAAQNLDQLVSTGRRTESELRKVGRQAGVAATGVNRLGRSADSVARSMSRFEKVIGGIFTAQFVRQVLNTADAYTSMNARLALVTSGAEQFARVQNDLFALAQSTRSSLGDTVDLYTRLARATQGLGSSEKELLTVTEAVNNALAISGASAAQAQGVLVQLGQGFASGVIRGEELNSILEGGGRLAEALANGMGKTVGELRKLGAEGAITAERAFGALLSQSGQLRAEMRQMPVTAQQGFMAVGNALVQMIGQIDKATGATGKLAAAFINLGNIVQDPKYALNRIFGLDDIGQLERQGKTIGNSINFVIQQMERMKPSVDRGVPAAIQQYKQLEAALKDLQAQQAAVNKQVREIANPPERRGTLAEVNQADNRRETAQLRARQAAWDELSVKYQSAADKNKALAAEIRTVGQAAGKSESEIAKLIASATKSDKAAAKDLLALRREKLASDIAAIKRDLDGYVSNFENAEALLEAARDAGLVNEADYYQERRRFIELTAQRREEAIQREVSALNAQKLSGDEAIANQRKIADLEAELSRVRQRATTEVKVLGMEQVSAAKRVETANQQALMAAQEYLRMLELQQQRELDAFGMGDQERRRVAGLSQIDDRYSQQIADLSRERAAAQTDEQRAQLDEQLRITRDFHAKAIDSYESYWDRLLQKQRDASVGLNEAIANYLDESRNVAQQTADAFSTAFTGLEDAIVRTVTTGKLEFRSLADAVLAEIARMLAKKAVAGLISGLFGGGGFGPAVGTGEFGFAKGGVFNKPTSFRFANGAGFSNGIMGEAGPEAVVPLKRGKDGKLGIAGGGGSVTVQNNLTLSGVQGQPTPRELQRIMERSTRDALTKARVRNGA